MTRIIATLSEISADYPAVYCDLWGCLHNGRTAFPAAVAALEAYRAQGGIVVLLTNSPRPKPAVITQLDSIGVPRDCYDEVASSGDAAQYGLLAGAVGRRVHHIGPDRDSSFFTDFAPDLQDMARSAPQITRVPLDQAEGLVCTGLFDDQTETPEDYRATLLMAKTRGLKLLCANPDLVVDFGDKRIYCAGAIAQAYDAMGGTSLYFGKPHPPIYDLARRRLAALAPGLEDRVLCIGDGIGTDVQGGVAEGLDVLFVTGGIDAESFGADPAHPDAGLLAAWLAGRQIDPGYAIGHLR
ncbi:TIGR01459 family HAD-type hydrolase [Paracoccaceae bacterium Fryx2]|nr:TIGR01459 family HAD-type hydrolase [Paracoccaceae bacterium Fryx2]